jgi:mono/diheme cytochrome c family protein
VQGLAARGVDIDARHEVDTPPVEPPSAARGVQVVAGLSEPFLAELSDPAWRRAHSPVEAWSRLVEAGLSEAEAWDAVAYLWLADLDVERRQAAASLYARNCAACHGERGDGRGPGADALAAQGIGGQSEMAGEHSNMAMAGKPAAFADAHTMLGGSGEIYYAKLRRGGMGTGMPSFGPLFSPEETWLLVDYLWTFVFDP